MLLALWDCQEKKDSVNELLKHIHLDILSRFALDNQLPLTLTGDYKILPILAGIGGANSNEPCIYCKLKVKKCRRSDKTQFLQSGWLNYLTANENQTIINAPPPVLDSMEILGYTSFTEFITPPSLHALLSLDRFIKIAIDPKRMTNDVLLKVR